MRILDLFCGAGGAGWGYHLASPDSEIIGVDINPQPKFLGDCTHSMAGQHIPMLDLPEWFIKETGDE